MPTEMVDDLLKLARVGQEHLSVGEVNLQTMVDGIRKSLASLNDEQIIVSEGCPKIATYPKLLKLVLINLIENALKFNESGVKRVEIRGREMLDDSVEIVVKDNGIGIDPQHHEQIFGVFRRLHTKSTYPGTGIGLAITKKAVTLMGGEVRLESTPEKGSTFIIDLPKTPPALKPASYNDQVF